MLNGYRLDCTCGHVLNFEHIGPATARDTVLVREVCPSCKGVTYGTIAGPKAYKAREETLALQMGILDIFDEQEPPLTVRQIYYQCTVKGLVPKTEAGYNKVQSQLTNMRRSGSVPYGWIADNSRSVFRSQMYQDAGDALSRMQTYYRRDLWQEQQDHVQIWVEKKALIGVLWPICREFGVPLFPCGGYSSISFVYEAAEELREIDKPVFVYHLGDFDYDGVHAAVTVEEELRKQGAVVSFQRLALHWSQITGYGLATREQKHTSSRRRWFVERYGDLPACELDALPPVQLRQLVHNAITAHIDPDAWQRAKTVEAEEKRTLRTLVEHGWQSN